MDTDLKEALSELKSDLKKEQDEKLDQIAEKQSEAAEMITALQEKLDSNQDGAEIKQKLADTHNDLSELADAVEALEKKGNVSIPADWVSVLVEQKGLLDELKQNRPFEVKDILTSQMPVQSLSPLIGARWTGIERDMPEKTFGVRALVRAAGTPEPIIHYGVSKFTNNSRVVAEGELKPKSEMSYELQTANVEVIAHHFVTSKQALSDISILEADIRREGVYGLMETEEQQMLYGNGVAGQELKGMVPQATAYDKAALPTVTAVNMMDDALIAAAQVRKESRFTATGVLVNPLDLAVLQGQKDADGRYLFNVTDNLWGMPIRTSDELTQGTFLIGAFARGAQIWDNWGVTIARSNENEDNFVRNMVTILIEKRTAIVVNRPQAFVTGEVSGGVSASGLERKKAA